MSNETDALTHNDADFDQLNWGTLRDWGQLVRLPTSFTLLSNSLAAAIVVDSLWRPLSAMLPAVLASLLAYWAGMILNDVVDIEEDRQHRPTRPLPAGKISPVVAGHVAKGMLLVGPMLILAINLFHRSSDLWLGASFMSSVILSLCVWAYNSPLKSTPLGPLLMGSCRSMNIIMVGSTLLAVNTGLAVGAGEIEAPAELPRALLAFAASIGIYIIGVTVYASREEGQSSAPLLAFGVLLEIVGLVGLGCLPSWSNTMQWPTLDPMRGFPLLICLIGLTVVNRGFSGVWHPVGRKVQLAVKHALLTLILLDASIVLMWAGPWYAVPVALLILPALISILRFRAT